jgi:hypothetical protein
LYQTRQIPPHSIDIHTSRTSLLSWSIQAGDVEQIPHEGQTPAILTQLSAANSFAVIFRISMT